MDEILDPLNIVIFVVAAVVLYRLYSVLGQRTGNEQPPRIEPRARDDKDTRSPEDRRGENVIPLPGLAPRPAGDEGAEGPAAPTSALDRALAHIVSIDRYFDKEQFLDGAAAAYEMIVMAFAAGDRKTLKPLLSAEVFEGFSRAIDERAAAGHLMETTFVGIEKAEIVEAEVQNKIARIKVRFVAEMISVTRDKDGNTVAGDPARVDTLIDGWTFERPLTASDPNWALVATETME